MPTLLYNLELDFDELTSLWTRLVLLESVNRLDDSEEKILRKVEELMEIPPE